MPVKAIKSLFAFAHKLGIIDVNVGRLVRSPAVESKLAERILTSQEVQQMISSEANPRNRAIIRLLYSGGLRVSELCKLKWRNLKPRNDCGQVTVFGKGGKTRTVLLPPGVWHEVYRLRENEPPDAPVFVSQKGGHLCRTQVYYIVRSAASKAGRGSVG